MTTARDPLRDLELRRLQLEEQIFQLRKTLQHWQTWDAEYEGFKEDLDNLGEDAAGSDILNTGKSFDGTLVSEDEVKSLLGPPKLKRGKAQVIGMLSRRMEYVQKNVAAVEKQLNNADEKLRTLLVVQKADVTTEEGLPLTEIVEELDEDGGIISSLVRAPGDSASELIESLQKAGVEDFPSKSGDSRLDENTESSPRKPPPDGNDNSEEFGEPDGRSIQKASSMSCRDKTPFMNGIQPPSSSTSSSKVKEPDFSSSIVNSTRPRQSGQASVLRTDQSNASVEEDDDPGVGGVKDTPEEAHQRREMLQYSINGLSEVGAVVAELEIDEEGVDDEAIDLPEEELYDMDGIWDDDVSDEDREEEDEYGRSLGKLVDDDYRRQMLELEDRLLNGGARNLGPDASIPIKDATVVPEPPKPAMAVKHTASKEDIKKKKTVAFADNLDIAPSPEKSSSSTQPTSSNNNVPPPMQESVIERTSHPSAIIPPTNPSKKPSRFKSSRKAPTTEAPSEFSAPAPTSGPPTDGPIDPHSATVIERQASPSNPKPPDPDDLDEDLHRQEVAREYFDVRSKMIRRQGGFTKESQEDQPIVPIPEEEGDPRKISRFRAARLK